MNEIIIIIMIAVLVIVILFLIWYRKSLYKPSGFGTWINGYKTNCINNTGKCSDQEIQYEYRFCKSDPISGKGCLDTDGTQKFIKIIEYPCTTQCIKSEWQTMSIGECLIYELTMDRDSEMTEKDRDTCKKKTDLALREITKICGRVDNEGTINLCKDQRGIEYKIGDVIKEKINCNDYKPCGFWSSCTNPFNLDESHFDHAIVETCPAKDCFGIATHTSTTKCNKIQIINGIETSVEVSDDNCEDLKPICKSQCVRYPCRTTDYTGNDVFLNKYFNTALFFEQNGSYLTIDTNPSSSCILENVYLKMDFFKNIIPTNNEASMKLMYLNEIKRIKKLYGNSFKKCPNQCGTTLICVNCSLCDLNSDDLNMSTDINIIIAQYETYKEMLTVPYILNTKFNSYLTLSPMEQKEERELYGLMSIVIPVKQPSNIFCLAGLLNNGVFGFLDLVKTNPSLDLVKTNPSLDIVKTNPSLDIVKTNPSLDIVKTNKEKTNPTKTSFVWYRGSMRDDSLNVKLENAPQFTAKSVGKNLFMITNIKTLLSITMFVINEYSSLDNIETTLHNPDHSLIVEYTNLLSKRSHLLDNK
jgi:hypothetical protein